MSLILRLLYLVGDVVRLVAKPFDPREKAMNDWVESKRKDRQKDVK